MMGTETITEQPLATKYYRFRLVSMFLKSKLKKKVRDVIEPYDVKADDISFPECCRKG
jgi:hypothetical protein